MLTEATVECMQTKRRAKPRVPKRVEKSASLHNRRDPTNINTQKLKKAQNELTNVYLKEQTEYIQNEINKNRDSVEDKQSTIAW